MCVGGGGVGGVRERVPEKVQPTIFDYGRIQLQRKEVVVQDSDRAASVDIQENQRPLHEARPLAADGRSLVRGRRRRRVRRRKHQLHRKGNQRCQP